MGTSAGILKIKIIFRSHVVIYLSCTHDTAFSSSDSTSLQADSEGSGNVGVR